MTEDAEGATGAASVRTTRESSGGEAAYGEYILRTGGALAEWEEVFSGYLYRSRFKGQRPILEMGPGRCAFTRQAPDDIVAVDNAPSLVAHYRRAGLQIHLGSAYNIPFEDGYFTAAYSCWLLEHLHEPARCLREVRRVLKPGGYMLMIVPSAQALLHGFYDDYTHVRPFTPQSLRQLAEDTGFQRFHVDELFWTRGLRRLIPLFGKEHVVSLLSISDRYMRRLRLINKKNLCLEAWA